MKWIALTALVIFALYIVMCGMLYTMQTRLLYFPTPEGRPTGGTALVVQSGGVGLKVWQLHGSARKAVLYFGGNAEDVSAKISEFDAIFPDRAVYLVHYRGYGGNPGTPSEKLLIADALAVYDLGLTRSWRRFRPACGTSKYFPTPRTMTSIYSRGIASRCANSSHRPEGQPRVLSRSRRRPRAWSSSRLHTVCFSVCRSWPGNSCGSLCES